MTDEIQLLPGGLSGSDVYKMTLQGRAYVLKLGQSSPALMLASDAGIAPRVFCRDASTGVTVTEYIESQPIRMPFSTEKLITDLARTIQSIHALPCAIPGRDLRQTIAGMIDGFASDDPIVWECFDRYEAVDQKYPWDDSDRVFSHNDLNPGNLLCDGERLWVIDWDAAFTNDRYVDLAAAANFFVQTEEQERAFLEAYFNNAVDEYKSARFYVMRQISRIVYSILLARAGAHHEVGRALMAEAVRQMRTPGFAGALGNL